MSTTLARHPLRTSLPMISDQHVRPELPADNDSRPLGYLYSSWDPGTAAEVETEPGYYDPDSQVWVTPGGGITAGVFTKTGTGGCPGDCVTDDACS
ncbi:hypothetical protein [Plantactinospora endophytica]|uniref:Uncharacterized protein n=1 Tax=Plantactinospora endophytica TaxID=673535 RepID=A0ABQ4E9C4_9ACTN|nr:hypothetical protein [Plantactinospora endophytica]GIG91312.1 hypothetical protein Pen02_62480 [Plantactinospora endophytica]